MREALCASPLAVALCSWLGERSGTGEFEGKLRRSTSPPKECDWGKGQERQNTRLRCGREVRHELERMGSRL